MLNDLRTFCSLSRLHARDFLAGLALLQAALATLLFPSTALSGEVIDLKDGARTTFYGNNDTLYPFGGDFFGWDMAFGDIDGDGYMDFLGSTANSEGPNDVLDHGQDVYLFFGRPRAEIDSLYDVDAAGVADIVFYRGGWATTCADIDNDGYDDVILSRPGGYVIFGGPRETLKKSYMFDSRHPDYAPPDILLVGSDRLGGRNWEISGGTVDEVSKALGSGDFNGDGYADIVIGDQNTLNGGHGGGQAYLIFGRPRDQFPAVIDVDPGSGNPHPDVYVYGESSERYPFHLTVGDLDGDGIDDLVTTTLRGWGEENILPQSSEVHVFWGRHAWKHIYDTQIEEFDFAIVGAPINRFGYRVTTGDLDGDGRDELIVATPHPSTGGRGNAGAYYVFFGRPRGLWPKWSRAIDMADVLILGADIGDAYPGRALWGFPISIATGNHDGDGYDDLLIGAGVADGPNDGGLPRSGAGEVYLLRGRPRGSWPPFIDLRDGYDTIFYGAQAGPRDPGIGGYSFDLLGFPVCMGDFDGNGLDDLFLSAQFADGPNNIRYDGGEVYVFFDADSVASPPTSVPAVVPRSTLLPNYPNPFNASTMLRFQAPVGEPVSITIYDVMGRRVAEPLASATFAANYNEVHWQARDARDAPLPSGVYFVKLRAGREVHARKVLLVR